MEGPGSAGASADIPSPRSQKMGAKKSEEKKPYARRKRPPQRLSQRPNDIYVSRKTDFASQLARSHRLLDQGCSELYIHGLGTAIHRAINLALQLKETHSHTPLSVACTTSSVELVDDLEPLDDETDYQSQTRTNSAIHIRVFKQQLSSLPSGPSPPPTPSTSGATRDGSGRGKPGQSRTL